MWSKPLLCRFPQSGKVPQTQASQGFAAFRLTLSRIQPRHSQSRRATNCATPGYFVILSGWSYSPKSSAIPTSLHPDIWFCGGVNLYVGRCVRETPPARQRHGALTVQTGFVRGGVRETTLILPCSAGKSNRVQADFLPAPCFA